MLRLIASLVIHLVRLIDQAPYVKYATGFAALIVSAVILWFFPDPRWNWACWLTLCSGGWILGLTALFWTRRNWWLEEIVKEFDIKDGDDFLAILNAYAAGDWEESTIRAILKKAKEDRLRAKEDLERQVAERTQELTEATRRLYHDIRHPLGLVIQYAENLSRRVEKAEIDAAVKEQYGKDLTTIIRQGNDLLSFADDLLAVFRPRTGQEVNLQLAECDLGREIEARVGAFEEYGRRRNVIVIPFSCGGLGVVYSDLGKILRILHNLLSNACKFTRRGGTVEVTGRRYGEGGAEWIELVVSDTGVGMTQEQLDSAFEPFRRATAGSTHAERGFGIGLPACRAYCKALGGTIELKSVPQREGPLYPHGTTATVRLPARIKAPAARAQPADTQLEQPPHPPGESPSSPVLFIRQDSAPRTDLQACVESLRLEPYFAPSAMRGLRWAKEHHPVAAVIGVQESEEQSADVDGWHVLASLKQDQDTASIPVILTALDEAGCFARSLNGLTFLVAPFGTAALRAEVRRLVGDRPGRALVCEDEAERREEWRTTLEGEGWNVHSHSTCADVTPEPGTAFDLLLLDARLVLRDQFRLLDRLRPANSPRPATILVINPWEKADLTKSVWAICRDRPVSLEDATRAIHDVLQRLVPGTAERVRPEGSPADVPYRDRRRRRNSI
jgi:signal transduction histidine kinase/CheY-like chemotaxis protein